MIGAGGGTTATATDGGTTTATVDCFGCEGCCCDAFGRIDLKRPLMSSVRVVLDVRVGHTALYAL